MILVLLKYQNNTTTKPLNQNKMSKLEQHQLWETYSVDLLKAIRRELAYADRFEAIKIVNEIIEKKLPKD